MLRLLKSYLMSVIVFTAAVIGLYTFVAVYFKRLSDEGVVGLFFLGSLASYLFVENLWLRTKFSRAARYGEVLTLISEGYSCIHALARRATATVDDAVMACERMCSCLSQALTTITGSRCSVTIKILVPHADRLKASTFCRDSNSAPSRGYSEVKLNHLIDENTDFRFILENIETPRGRFFFSNRLPLLYNYFNTSFPLHTGSPDNVFHVNNWLLRWWRWPLPYKSTIVVPICPCISKRGPKADLIGFLCVDSPRMFVFKKDYDVDLLRGIADGVYNVISDARARMTP